MTPLISIIVPVYKVEKYLPKCVDSILAQTYRNLEIILVDDGSPDNCGKICDEYAQQDARIRVIHKENGGLSSARNAGIDICRGDYLSFIDSDDFVSPFFIEILFRGIERYQSDIASVRRGVSFLDDVEDSVKLAADAADCAMEEIAPREAIRLMMYQVLPNGAPWRMYKREIFREIRYPVGWLYEDAATTYKTFILAKKMTLIKADIYAYRLRPDSIMRMKFSNAKMICTTIGEQIVRDITAYDPGLRAAACSRAFSINYNVFLQTPPENRAALRELWQQLLKYRSVVAKDKAPELRLKNRVGARCTYLGMHFSYGIGRLYKMLDTRKQNARILKNKG